MKRLIWKLRGELFLLKWWFKIKFFSNKELTLLISYLKEYEAWKNKKIICSAIKLPSWTVVTGLRHNHCFETIFLLKEKLKPWTEIQWFIDNKNKFLEREEALKVILNNRQVIAGDREFLKTQKILFSEDLY